jgi:enoyl-CoA hydratase
MTEPTTSFFNVEIDGPVATVFMNRPDKANSMTPDFWTGLPTILAELEANERVRCAIIAGEGKHFTSGMDLSTFSTIATMFQSEPGRAAHALRQMILRLQETFTALERARFPVIAAVHGACIGAGIDMITACDLRIASTDAFFSVEEIHIGMAADVGTLQRLPKLIAPAVAAELAYSGRRFPAEEAKAIGLISSLYDGRDTLLAAAHALAGSIATKSPLAISGIKRNLAYSRDHSVADGLDYIATWNAGMLRSEDLMAAIQARMAKRDADFADLLPPA